MGEVVPRHQVRHVLHTADHARAEFRCTAVEGADCRMTCKRCMDTSEEYCICESVTESGSYDTTEDVPGEEDVGREPDMQDIGRCLIIDWLREAPEECFNGEDGTEVRGPGWQPITPEWNGDSWDWDYSS